MIGESLTSNLRSGMHFCPSRSHPLVEFFTYRVCLYQDFTAGRKSIQGFANQQWSSNQLDNFCKNVRTCKTTQSRHAAVQLIRQYVRGCASQRRSASHSTGSARTYGHARPPRAGRQRYTTTRHAAAHHCQEQSMNSLPWQTAAGTPCCSRGWLDVPRPALLAPGGYVPLASASACAADYAGRRP